MAKPGLAHKSFFLLAMPKELRVKQGNSGDFHPVSLQWPQLQVRSLATAPPLPPLSIYPISLLSIQVGLGEAQVFTEKNGVFRLKCKQSLL